MKIAAIYKIENLINGKVYIGSSQDVRQRLRMHKSQLKRGIHGSSHLQASFNKYGEENFYFSIVEIVEKQNLIEKEKYYIEKHKALERKFGYNKASIIENTSGYKWSEESRKKLSNSKTGKKQHPNTLKALIKANTGHHYNLGRIHNKESKIKMGNSHKVTILQYSLEGVFIKEWESAENVENSLNIQSTQIRQCCLGNRFMCSQYQWFDKPKNNIYPLQIPIYKKKSKNKTITEFKRLCLVMSIEKKDELLEKPEMKLDEK